MLRSSASGSSCWDIYPRLTGVEQRAAGLAGPGHLRRAKLASLARRRTAPGLLAYRGREAVGWISIGPRLDYHRIARSRATPPVDEERVWVIPCITVRQAYPRADRKRVHDEWAFYGTEALFKKAGFKTVRGTLPVPKGWTPRVTMRSHDVA